MGNHPRAAAGRGRRASPSRRRWARAAVVWCLVFAAPHLYWAVGGRAGLGAQAAAADEALATPWFFAYNLLAAGLAVAGAVVAFVLSRPGGDARIRRALRAAAWAACAVLLLRGFVGVTLLTLDLAQGVTDSPPLLAAVEPWFVLGGMVFGGLAAHARPTAQPTHR